MPIDYVVENMGEFALITAHGQINSVNEAIDYAQCLIKDVVRLGARRVLIDDREVIGLAMSFFDSFEVASFIEENADLRQVKFALVVPPQRLRSARDLETLIRNRGFSFFGFKSINDAMEWLSSGGTVGSEKQSLKKNTDCANYS